VSGEGAEGVAVTVSVVTGGTRGIGYAIATALLRRGDAVAVTGSSRASADRAAEKLREHADASRVMAVPCDVRDGALVQRTFDDVAERFGGIDVLVNNAGIGVFRTVAEMSHDDWNRVVDTNLTGVFHCSKAVLPHLRRRNGGWIVSISSLASKNPFVGGAAYSASKAALNAFSEALMQEVRHDNIRVSYVLPGSVATEFSGRAVTSGADWRLAPEDVAQVIVDLLGHPARSLPSRVEIRPSRPQKS
jgi:NAD(P)-dependent dehydrogenase (short-subunit alcohol dehydrogenase family)